MRGLKQGKSFKQYLAAILVVFLFSAKFAFSYAASVDTVLIFSKSMHKNVKCVVIKPAVYNDETKRFPVVY